MESGTCRKPTIPGDAGDNCKHLTPATASRHDGQTQLLGARYVVFGNCAPFYPIQKRGSEAVSFTRNGPRYTLTILSGDMLIVLCHSMIRRDLDHPMPHLAPHHPLHQWHYVAQDGGAGGDGHTCAQRVGDKWCEDSGAWHIHKICRAQGSGVCWDISSKVKDKSEQLDLPPQRQKHDTWWALGCSAEESWEWIGDHETFWSYCPATPKLPV